MKKLLLVGLMVVSAAALGNTTHNEEVSADIDMSLRVRQPLSILVHRGNVDFGMLVRGETATVPVTHGEARGLAGLKGEPGATIETHFLTVATPDFTLTPTLAVHETQVENGGTFVLNGNPDSQDAGYRDLYFGGTVEVSEEAATQDHVAIARYTFKYQ